VSIVKRNPSSDTIVASLAVLLLMAASTKAALINVGDYVFAPNTGVHTLTIAVSGNEKISGEDFYAQIGDGGSFNHGTNDHPTFSNVDIITGTPFATNNVGAFGDASAGGNAAHRLIWVDGTTTSSGTVQLQPTSILATISIDTQSAPLGKFSLDLTGVANTLGSFNTKLYDSTGAPIPLTVTNGSITIVPEPSLNAVLAIVPALFMLRRPMRRLLIPAWS
jgi:hypothetical protein